MVRARACSAAAVAALVGTLAACTSEPTARTAEGPRSTPDPTSSAPSATSDHRSSDDPSPDHQTGQSEGCTEPLVLVQHHARGPRDLTLRQARTLARSARAVTSVDDVVAERGAVGVLPAHEVDPRVRAVRVAGVDPLRRPAAYPLQVETDRCPPRQATTLTVVGDVMLGRGVAAAAAGEPGRQLGPTSSRLRSADVTAGNLESTLSQAGAPRQGGDSFAADPVVAGRLVDAGFDVLSLANNHAGDFGPLALRQTVARLHRAGLATFGAGRDLAAARRPAVVEAHGTRFGFVGFNAIGETPEAGPGATGAVSVSMPPRTGPLDQAELRRFLGDVRRLDRRVDVVVVMPHWGTQYTNRPEPVQRHVARQLVAAGADLVVGGHPHWVQGVSMVDDAVVAQSLGNFVFDMDFMAETMVGVVLETVWWDDRLMAAEPVPYRMDATFTPRFVDWRAGRPTLRLMGETGGPAYRF